MKLPNKKELLIINKLAMKCKKALFTYNLKSMVIFHWDLENIKNKKIIK